MVNLRSLCLATVLTCGAASLHAQPAGATRPAPMRFDSAVAWIRTATDSVRVQLEVAATSAQRGRGLQWRESLPADRGMLFVYPAEQDSTLSYWMWRTFIPLDIAYLDRDGRILRISTMEPCGHVIADCRSHPAGVRFWSALETNRGFFQRHGITPGMQVRVERRDPSARER